MNTEDVERRAHWSRLAIELGQEDDFRALLDDVRAEIEPRFQPSMKMLSLINTALLTGRGMTQANAAFRELCRGYGVNRDTLS